MMERMANSDRDNIEYASRTDEQLAELCKKRDQAAFQELMRRYLKPIYNFSYQYGKDESVAEDIAQDAFFKAWKHMARYTKGRAFKPWLYTIARNTALDHLKKRKAAAFSDLDDADNDVAFADSLADVEPLPPELFERSELAHELGSVMQHLPPDYRAVLVLHYRSEMTFDEIAEIMDAPMNTVKSWHRRALIKLRELLMHRRP